MGRLAVVPEPGCQETGRKETGTVLLSPGSFSQRAKAKFQSTEALLRKMLGEAQGKRTSAERICGHWASLPANMAPKVLQEKQSHTQTVILRLLLKCDICTWRHNELLLTVCTF